MDPERFGPSQLTALEIAAVCHAANQMLCLTQGDTSQPDWMQAPQWQRDSAVAGVMAIVKNPATTPEQSHEGWLAHKRADGWTYGEVKDAAAKTHPCFRPYAELPARRSA